MQLIKKLEIQSKYKIIEFLNSEPVGRIASLDPNGFPQVIPMNFVFVQANDPRVKGNAMIVEDNEEKSEALNLLMEKYQKEGKYEQLDPYMPSVHEVTVIKIVPEEMRGKYKIGQHWAPAYRLKMARNIVDREEKKLAREILDIMRIDILANGSLKIREEPSM